MLKKLILIFIIMLEIILFLAINIYAKYNYNFSLHAFSLSRDNSEIIYNINKSENEYTNKDILLSINFNKAIEKIDGFDISEDGKTITKLINKNENNTINVEDISGNKKQISYSINNLDKQPPEIIGIEDGGVYEANKKIEYSDNIGIKSISIDRFSNLSIDCQEDYYDKRIFKGIDVLGNSIHVKVKDYPKGTKYYQYYLNGDLKLKTENKEFTYTNLNLATKYNIKIEAVNENGKVIETVNKAVTTKHFKDIKVERTGDSFKITVYGLDPKVKNVIAIGFTTANKQYNLYPIIDSSRNISASFNIKDITGVLQGRLLLFSCAIFFGKLFVFIRNFML